MNSVRPDIFGYHDYRVFLNDWLAFRKAGQSRFSLRMLAKQAGLASGYLSMVLSAKRELSTAALLKLMPHLGLSATEQSFFENLLVLGSTDSHEVRLTTLDRMKRFQQYQKLNPQDSEVYEYLKHWYYVAIREMATLKNFKADPEWIQAQIRFALPLKDVKEALSFLLSHGYLEKTLDGSIRQPEKSLVCSGGIYRVALGNLHREVLALAQESIEKVPSAERMIQGHSCKLSPKGFDQAVEIVNRAIADLRTLAENDSECDSVYQMEIALFPLASHKVRTK